MGTEKRSPDEIEARIGLTRDALDQTLGALGRKFEPTQLMEQGVGMISQALRGQSLSGKAADFGQAVAKNPIPLALIGVGIGWLLFSAKKPPQPAAPVRRNGRDTAVEAEDLVMSDADVISRTAARIEQLAASVAEELRASASDPATEAVERLRHGANGVVSDSFEAGAAAYDAAHAALPLGETIRRFGETTYDRAAGYVDDATDAVRDAGDRVGEVVDRYPLAISGLAALAGALMALGLPPTTPEDRVMGGTRDALRDRALDSGRDALARAEDTASRAAAAALDAARDEVEVDQTEAT